MTLRRMAGLFALLACVLFVGACGTDDSDSGDAEEPAAQEETQSNTGEQSEFFVQEDYDRQLAQREVEPEGPADKPWEQAIEPEMVDTAEYKSDKSNYNICFSNAAVDNPWRQVGWKTMQEEVKLHDEIGNFRAVDAEASDDKQISDIESLAGGNCDALIVSPNTTATLTPAVEAACKRGPDHRVRPRRRDRLPGHVHPPDRRLRVRRRRGRVPGRQRRRGRQDPRAADPARRGRARDALVGGQGDLRRVRPERGRRRVHRRRRGEDEVDRVRLHPARGRDRRRLDGRRRHLGGRQRGVRGRGRRSAAGHRRGPAGLPGQVAGGGLDHDRADVLQRTSGGRRSSRR